jgi:hypothetical protein
MAREKESFNKGEREKKQWLRKEREIVSVDGKECVHLWMRCNKEEKEKTSTLRRERGRPGRREKTRPPLDLF